MDAETRAVAERLRDGLTRRHGGFPDGCVLVTRDGVRYVSVPCCYAKIRPGKRAIWDPPPADAVPDLSAPATWGVLLGLLLSHARTTEWLLTAWRTETAGLMAIVEGDGYEPPAAVDHDGYEPASLGLALARALLAAWGQG